MEHRDREKEERECVGHEDEYERVWKEWIVTMGIANDMGRRSGEAFRASLPGKAGMRSARLFVDWEMLAYSFYFLECGCRSRRG